jgi:hypothetical protein
MEISADLAFTVKQFLGAVEPRHSEVKAGMAMCGDSEIAGGDPATVWLTRSIG